MRGGEELWCMIQVDGNESSFEQAEGGMYTDCANGAEKLPLVFQIESCLVICTA